MNKVAAVSMFKNEEDIAYHTLDHLVSEGVDVIIVADNLSTDNTRQELERAQRQLRCQIVIVEDPDFAYRQDEKMTALTHRARKEFGVEWIIPFDADEIWYADKASLRETLLAQPAGVTEISASVHNHCVTAQDTPDSVPFRSLLHRRPTAEAYVKVAFRYSDGISVHMGNHGVSRPRQHSALFSRFNGKSAVSGLHIRHFHRRSFEQYAQKVQACAEALVAARKGPEVGLHWRKNQELLEVGGLDALRAEWEAKHYSANPQTELVLDPAPFKRRGGRPLCRYDIINALINKYRYTRYLEIGVDQRENFSKIRAPYKDSVDPNGKAVFNMTSDVFFSTERGPYDIVFVDGLHTRAQALRDIDNALRCLAPGGSIVVHDCLPGTERHQLPKPAASAEAWTGDVWKAWVQLRSERDDLSMFVVDTDWGCGVIQRGQQQRVQAPAELSWSIFVQQRNALLNVIDPQDFLL